MKSRLILAVASAALVTACGASPTSAPPAAKHTAAPMTLAQACQALRSDMNANGGQADRPTLEKIASHTAAAKLAADARQAEPDVGNGNTWWIDAGLLAHDCAAAGVNIPVSS